MPEHRSMLQTLLFNSFSKRMNRELIGYGLSRSFPPIQAERVGAFTAATSYDDSSRQGQGVSPFFLATLAFPLVQSAFCHKRLGLNLLKMVHGETWMECHRPVRVGDAVTIHLVIEAIEESSAGELLRVKNRVVVGTELAVEATVGMLVRTGGKPRGKRPMQIAAARKERRRLVLSTREGQQLDYAKVSGDHNFIHTKPWLARLAGLPRTIMHGMCVMAMAERALIDAEAAGDANRLQKMGGRFAAPALPGQTLALVVFEPDAEGSALPYQVLGPSGRPVIKNGRFGLRG